MPRARARGDAGRPDASGAPGGRGRSRGRSDLPGPGPWCVLGAGRAEGPCRVAGAWGAVASPGPGCSSGAGYAAGAAQLCPPGRAGVAWGAAARRAGPRGVARGLWRSGPALGRLPPAGVVPACTRQGARAQPLGPGARHAGRPGRSALRVPAPVPPGQAAGAPKLGRARAPPGAPSRPGGRPPKPGPRCGTCAATPCPEWFFILSAPVCAFCAPRVLTASGPGAIKDLRAV